MFKTKKRILVGVTALIMIIILAACGNNGNESGGSNNEQASGKVYELKLGHNVTVDSEMDKGANKFKQLIEEKTNGQVKVTIFPSAQLGSEIDMVENLGQGAIDIVIPGDGAFGSYFPEYQALVLPFLIESTDHLDKVYNGEIGDEINEILKEKVNARMMSVWHRGARNITANKEVLSPDDLKGMKLRVTTIPMIVDAWKALGANPTPIAFSELFVALQQGTVDAQENPLDLIYTSKFDEVQSHVMMSQHTFSPWLFLVNNDLYEGFPEDIKSAFDEALEEATAYQNQLVADSQEEYKQLLQDKGVTIVEVNRDLFKQKLIDSGLEAQLAKDTAPDLFDRVRALR